MLQAQLTPRYDHGEVIQTLKQCTLVPIDWIINSAIDWSFVQDWVRPLRTEGPKRRNGHLLSIPIWKKQALLYFTAVD